MRGCVLILGERHAIQYFKDILLKYISLNKDYLNTNESFG